MRLKKLSFISLVFLFLTVSDAYPIAPGDTVYCWQERFGRTVTAILDRGLLMVSDNGKEPIPALANLCTEISRHGVKRGDLIYVNEGLSNHWGLVVDSLKDGTVVFDRLHQRHRWQMGLCSTKVDASCDGKLREGVQVYVMPEGGQCNVIRCLSDGSIVVGDLVGDQQPRHTRVERSRCIRPVAEQNGAEPNEEGPCRICNEPQAAAVNLPCGLPVCEPCFQRPARCPNCRGMAAGNL